MEHKLNLIFQKIIGIKFELGIERMTTPKWDSISHVKLILELEKEFHISISFQEAVSIFSTNDILQLLRLKC